MPEAGSDAATAACTSDAELVAALLCVDPVGLGGVALRAAAGEARDAWLALTRSLMPHGTPWRRVPLHIQEDRLLGGLDLAATLQAGRPVLQSGLLAECDGGIAVLCMAQRVDAGAAARMAAVLDTRSVRTLRDGISAESACRIAVIALDEGASDDEAVATVLLDRLAFRLSVAERSPRGARTGNAIAAWAQADVDAARAMLAAVSCDAAAVRALCAASLALGIDSLRAPLFALRAAHACAALHGRFEVQDEDIAAAARLVLLPRATAVLEEEMEEVEEEEPAAAPAESPPDRATNPAEADAAPGES
ncbi:MAG: magnesium chelatase ATPase subunit D, partial [Gammaproteobacteria bacterium]|nr:magnesium chelatase ATPase subunit D [Gammaproteobacteria bacterium]